MFPPDQPLPSKEIPVLYVFMGDYALTLCARAHTHTHINIPNEKIPQKLQEESRRTSSVVFHVPARLLQIFLA